MSGHSRWAGIKHKKAAVDAKKGKAFTKLGKEITVAAKQGGGNPENNARLRKAIEDAREANMPQENVKRAVQRGTGEIPGVIIEEVRYEGYGPGGVAILVEGSTDNRNRTNSELRKIFSDHGGNMAEAGAVGWMFSTKGVLTVEKSTTSEDVLMDIVLSAGAQDLKTEDAHYFEVFAEPADFEAVKKALQDKKIPFANAQITQVSQNMMAVSGETAESVIKLVQALDEHDDVSKVYGNYDIPQEVWEKVNAE